MFESLSRLLQAQSAVWADGHLVFDGGPNPLGTADALGVSAFIRGRVGGEPVFGTRQTVECAHDRLRQLSLIDARAVLMNMLRDELRMFASQGIDEASLASVVDAFIGEFESPACFSNFRGEAWTSVTHHARDSLFAMADDRRVGYWLTSDDE